MDFNKFGSITHRLNKYFLEDSRLGYLVTFVAIAITTLVVNIVLLFTSIEFLPGRISQLLLTLATVQLTLLVIVFAVTVMGVQYSGRILPAEVATVYLKTPIFRLTLVGLTLVAVFELISYSILYVFSGIYRDILISSSISSGIIVLFLPMIYVLLMPIIITIPGLLDYYSTHEGSRQAIKTGVQTLWQLLEQSDVKAAQQTISFLKSQATELAEDAAETPFGSAPITLNTLIVDHLPNLIRKTIEQNRNELLSQFRLIYVIVVKISIRCDYRDGLKIVNKGLKRIFSPSNQHEIQAEEALEYRSIFEDSLKEVEYDKNNPASVQTLISLLDFNEYVCLKLNQDILSTNLFYTRQTALAAYRWAYRYLVFNYDANDFSYSPNDLQVNDESSNPNQLRIYLVSLLEKLIQEAIDPDTEWEADVPIPQILVRICETITENWGIDYAIPIIAIYLETAYILSPNDDSPNNRWHLYYNNIDDLNYHIDSDKTVEEKIVEWYNRDGVTRQLSLDEVSLEKIPDFEFESWRDDFLESI